MQRKWFAIVLAVAVLSVVVVSTADEQSDADGPDIVTYYVNLGSESEKTLNLILNENYYQKTDIDYTLKWSYQNDVPEYVSLTDCVTDDNGFIQGDGFKFKLTKDSTTVGKYKLNLVSTVEGSRSVVLNMKCEINITIPGGLNSDERYDADPLYIHVNISLNNGTNLPESLSYRIDGDEDSDPIELGYIDIYEGQPISLTPVISDPRLFNWYAYDLPKGLAMTKTGDIVGVPVEQEYDPHPSVIYIEDGYGNSKTFYAHFFVMENDTNLSFYLYNGSFGADTDMSLAVHEPDQFITERQRTVTLAVCDKDVKVSVVSVQNDVMYDPTYPSYHSTLDRTILTGQQVVNDGRTYYCYGIPTDGTGLYKVVISDKETDVKLDTFDLYVMSRLLAVESEIIVGSDGTRVV